MNRKMKYALSLLAVVSFCFSSCDEKTYDFDSLTEAVYVSSPTATTVNSKPNFFTIDIFKTPFSVIGESSIKFPVRSTVPAKSNAVVTLDVNNNLVEQFNQKNNTTYSTLPSELVKVVNSQLTIQIGNYLSKDSVEISIDKDKIANLEVKDYLVPVEIKSVTGHLSVSGNMNKVYLLIKMKEDKDNIYNINPSDKGTLVSANDRKTWSVSTVNSSINGVVTNLFDNNMSNYIYYPINSFDDNTSFVVDMKKNYPSLSGILFRFYSNSYNFRKADVYSSENNTDWTLQGVVENNSGNWEIIFYSKVSARYLKFIPRIVSNSGVYINEFNVYTK